MRPELTDADKRLIAAYVQATLLMERELATFKKPDDQARILRKIDAILAQLDSVTAEYVNEDLPEQFKIGSALAIAELGKLRLPDIDTGFSGIHQEAVRSLADSARVRFGQAIDAVRRDATVKLSAATKEHVVQQQMLKEIGAGVDPTKAAVAIIRNQGITAIRTRNGANRGLEDYADTLVRSISADAHNTGAATRYAANGVEFAEVIERETACQICGPMSGKAIWLGDPRLRPPYHPRCRGGIIPLIGNVEDAIRSVSDNRIPDVTRESLLRK